MKANAALFSIALIVLFSQLLTLQPQLLFGPYATGDFVASVEQVLVKRPYAIYEATLATKKQYSYESVVFVGDIMLGRNVEYLASEHGAEYPFSGWALPMVFNNAAIIGNFESSMATPHVVTPAYAMKFSVAEHMIPELSKAGFTHLSLANNHSFDYGTEGFKTTQSMLLAHGLYSFGNGITIDRESVTTIDTVRGTIAMVGLNATARIPTDEEIKRVMNVAQRRSSFQVIYIHWGNEYELTHSTKQRELAEMLVAAGADLIIGHHPHVTQDVDIIDGVIVFYSLGNYIFDQYFSVDVQEGLLAQLDLTTDPQLTLIPVTAAATLSVPEPMDKEARQNFLIELSKRSHPSLKEKIQSGVIPLLDTVATSTKVAMM